MDKVLTTATLMVFVVVSLQTPAHDDTDVEPGVVQPSAGLTRLAPGEYSFTVSHGDLTRHYEFHVPPMRSLARGGSYCDAVENCADGVVDVLCGVDAGHDVYPDPDIHATDVTRDVLAPVSLR